MDVHEEPVIDDAMLRQLDAEQQKARSSAEAEQRIADAKAVSADYHRTQVSMLDATRAYLAPRMGMPVDQVLAEVDEELTKAQTAEAEAHAEAERLREYQRDLQGYIRVSVRGVLARYRYRLYPGRTPGSRVPPPHGRCESAQEPGGWSQQPVQLILRHAARIARTGGTPET